MGYFDNAATTFPKPECVYTFMDEFYRQNGASAGRGQYQLSQSAGSLISDTRVKIQKLLHCPAKQVVFTPTATVALNIIIQGLIKSGYHNIYISPFEHNAVTRILHHFEQEKVIKVHRLQVSKDMEYDLHRIRYQFDSVHPDIVIVSHASNVCGLVAPVEDIFSIAKIYGAITVVDMAQTAGLVDCNVGLATFDFAVFAGHKTLYGPTGIAGFLMNQGINLPVVIFGGTGHESANQNMPASIPERYEMGTLNISGVAGLNAALAWIEETGIRKIAAKEKENRQRLLELLTDYDFIKIVGNSENGDYVGIVSCVIDGLSSDSVGVIFDQCGISVRTGLQCAPFAHEFLGTYPAGTIRLSVNYFTSEKDYEELQETLDYIEDNL